MVKYFTGNTEVNWSKTLRGTHDNQGINEKRVASHNSRFGFRSLNKGNVSIFPFSFLPMGSACNPHARSWVAFSMPNSLSRSPRLNELTHAHTHTHTHSLSLSLSLSHPPALRRGWREAQEPGVRPHPGRVNSLRESLWGMTQRSDRMRVIER